MILRHALVFSLLLACSSPGTSNNAPASTPAASAPTVAERASGEPSNNGASPAAPRYPYSTVDDPATMQALTTAGAQFDALVAPAWRAAIRKRLTRKLESIARADANAGVGIRGNSHRLFNARWLEEGDFELIGLTYRSERMAMDRKRCGDVRLVYRLAYQTEVSGEKVHSRLPMTVLLELAAAKADPVAGCAKEASRWLHDQPVEGEALANFLLSGALRDRLQSSEIVQLLVNTQVVRWPSSVRPSLGGHAEYSMLAFQPSEDRTGLSIKPLENQPDLTTLRRSVKLRADLLTWIGHNLQAIDDGSAILPERFLAREATSVTPRGLSRRSNRPFRQIFDAGDFSGLDLGKRRRIASAEALLRRLDDMSCVGCHQSRTIAGFHWLGVDAPDVAPGNALFVSRSVPLLADARRRDAYLLQAASGQPSDFSRPFAERDDTDPGLLGSRCGLGDPGFAAWTCSEGLVCDAYDAPVDDTQVGVCTTPGPAAQGDFCQVAQLSATSNPHRDRAANAPLRPCQRGVCNINRTGFPGGMCTSSCAEMGEDGSCGLIAVLTPFNNCLARKTPFPSCLTQHVRPAGLRACDAQRPCRDDYVCSTTPEGEGACIPPYFLFQLRVDGHP